MNDERRLKVAKLALAYSHARARYDALSMRNTSSLTREEQQALDVAYALAKAEWIEARDALDHEVGR